MSFKSSGWVILGANLRRQLEKAARGLPNFPDPKATCHAHNVTHCRLCSMGSNIDGLGDPCCIEYLNTGMHCHICPNRRAR